MGSQRRKRDCFSAIAILHVLQGGEALTRTRQTVKAHRNNGAEREGREGIACINIKIIHVPFLA